MLFSRDNLPYNIDADINHKEVSDVVSCDLIYIPHDQDANNGKNQSIRQICQHLPESANATTFVNFIVLSHVLHERNRRYKSK